MSNLSEFRYGDHQEIRVALIEDEPWFVAKDVCDVLDHSNSRKALERLDEDEKGVTTIYTPGGNQEMSIVSESGLYSLIFTSRRPEAKTFKRWVTHEVLPSIRKKGYYALSQKPSEEMPAWAVKKFAEIEDKQAQEHAFALRNWLREEQIPNWIAEKISKLEAALSFCKEAQERLDRLESHFDEALDVLRLPYPEVAVPSTTRQMVHFLVSRYCVRFHKRPNEVWNTLYGHFRLRCSFDARLRAKEAGKSPLDVIELAGLMDSFYSVAYHLLINERLF